MADQIKNATLEIIAKSAKSKQAVASCSKELLHNVKSSDESKQQRKERRTKVQDVIQKVFVNPALRVTKASVKRIALPVEEVIQPVGLPQFDDSVPSSSVPSSTTLTDKLAAILPVDDDEIEAPVEPKKSEDQLENLGIQPPNLSSSSDGSSSSSSDEDDKVEKTKKHASSSSEDEEKNDDTLEINTTPIQSEDDREREQHTGRFDQQNDEETKLPAIQHGQQSNQEKEQASQHDQQDDVVQEVRVIVHEKMEEYVKIIKRIHESEIMEEEECQRTKRRAVLRKLDKIIKLAEEGKKLLN